MSKRASSRPSLPKDPFAYIGFWQFMTFIMLLLLVWFNELRDASGLFFLMPSGEMNYIRGFLLSAAVFLTAIITIGNTYIQQKRVLNSLLSICSRCHKVQVNEETWRRVEDYFGEISLLSFTHGFCPECKHELMKTVESRSGIAREAPHDKPD